MAGPQPKVVGAATATAWDVLDDGREAGETAARVTVGVLTVWMAGVGGFGTTRVVAGVGLMIATVVSTVVGIGGTT